ncbi:unnamed protein product [Bursaphelenchus xylophilus]|uniref:(pine wood nematode) hypothetical protein n=1 Tax=Bursaphelenchus xylophilus TaxID=6326 RepID=A0A7I8WGL0_BURXY|nr:unnamed protein product [Bursaphelenchus xylophilus]CAG9111009.1 unnamed protein product [Bursaphelenchus xylophilus]
MFSLRFFLRKSESFGREGALKGPGAQFPRRPPGSIPPLAGGGKNGKKRRKGWRLLTQPTVTTPPTPLNSNLRHDLLPSGRTTTTRSVEVNKPFPRQKAAESLQVTLSVAFRGGATAPSASQVEGRRAKTAGSGWNLEASIVLYGLPVQPQPIIGDL